MPWIQVGLLICIISYLAVKVFKAVTSTTMEETERKTVVILFIILIVAFAFAVRHIATHSLAR